MERLFTASGDSHADPDAARSFSVVTRMSGLMLVGAMIVTFSFLLDSDLRWTNVVADTIIGLSYVAISSMLFFTVAYFRKTMTFQWVFAAFAAFIVSCGVLHFTTAVTDFLPIPRTEAIVKLITALLSLMTAVLLPGIFPKLKLAILQSKEKQEEANRRADAMNAQLRNANNAKDEFLAIVSHELRTPMTAVMGWVQLIKLTLEQDEECSPVIREGFQQIEMACKTQTRLVEDLLDMSKLTLGQFSVRLMPVDFRQLVNDVVDSLRPNFAAKGIDLVSTDSDVGFVQGDPVRLRQVLWNLLYNALKFTDRGIVYVRLDKFRNMARVTFKDTGRGIAASDIPTIFEKLNKASGPPSAHGGGLGLGLSLTKNIVTLHAGYLYAESEGEGQGATFTLLLPCL